MAVENEQFNTVFTWATRGLDQLLQTNKMMGELAATNNKFLNQTGQYRRAAVALQEMANLALTPLRGMRSVLEEVGFVGTRSLEQLATAFRGNQESAKAAFDWTSKFALRTTDSVGEVTEAFTGFANFGIDAMRNLGEETYKIAGETFSQSVNLMGTVANIAARTGRSQASISQQIVQAVTSSNADALEGLVDRATIIHLKMSGAMIGTIQDVSDRLGRILNITSSGAAARTQATLKGFTGYLRNLVSIFQLQMLNMFGEGGMFGEMQKWIYKAIHEVLEPFFVKAGGIQRVARVIGEALQPWVTRFGKLVYHFSQMLVWMGRFVTEHQKLVKTFINWTSWLGVLLSIVSAILSAIAGFRTLAFAISKIPFLGTIFAPLKWVVNLIFGIVNGTYLIVAAVGVAAVAVGLFLDKWIWGFKSMQESWMWFKYGINEFFVKPFTGVIAMIVFWTDAIRQMIAAVKEGRDFSEFMTSEKTWENLANLGEGTRESMARGAFAMGDLMSNFVKGTGLAQDKDASSAQKLRAAAVERMEPGVLKSTAWGFSKVSEVIENGVSAAFEKYVGRLSPTVEVTVPAGAGPASVSTRPATPGSGKGGATYGRR